MVLTGTRLIPLLLILISCSGNDPVEQTSSSPKKKSGETLFLQHCAMCHGEDGRLGVGGAANLSETNLNKEGIRMVLKNGKNAMPPMISELGGKQGVDAVIAYTLELAEK